MTRTDATIPARLRRLLPAVAIAGAVAVGALTLGSPAANAIPESTIKSECQNAGGSYVTRVAGGIRYSSCCYKDINGLEHCDYYKDGVYQYTWPEKAPPTDTTSPPKGDPSTLTPPVVGPDVGSPQPPKAPVPTVPVQPPAVG